MNTRNLMLFLFFVLPFFSFAQKMPEYSITNIDPELLENANEIVRVAYGEFEVHSDKEGTAYYKTVITLLNGDSSAENLYFSYSNQNKISKISISLYDAFGNLIRKVKRSDLKDYSAIADFSIYDDARYKYYQASHFSYPYTIAYEYEETLSGIPFAAFPNWFVQSDYHCSVESSEFKIKVPEEVNFHYRVLNIEDRVQKEQEKDLTVFSWEYENVPALVREVDMPLPGEVFPTILTAPDQFKIDKYEGGMSSWEEFSAFIQQLFNGKDKLPEEFVDEIKDMVKSAKTEKEKINILYNYLQENYRYVSVQLDLGGWEPFDAEYVYRNKYGDCKALTNFMGAMLKVAGVESLPALIGNGSMFYHVSEDFTTSIFNHVILYVPGIDYWLECTSSQFPPNYVGSGNANRNALLIKETGGHLIKTPELKAQDNSRESTTQIKFKEDGSAEITEEISAYGSRHELYRAIKNQLSETETIKWLENETSIPAVSFKSFHVSANENAPKSTFSYEAVSRRFGSKAGKRIFLPLNVVNNYKRIPPKKQKRMYPVNIKEGFVEEDSIIIHLPVGYGVESIPEESIFLEEDFGNFEMTVETTQNKLIISRRIELKKTTLAPDQYDKYRNFFKQVAKADSHKAVLVRKA
ncbi:MAG: DUF3857 domain-containing protein [Bacteroidetes bacterium]|nr:MAG: DUF3857 domain-containing protein [Bacteroidota bacterium]